MEDRLAACLKDERCPVLYGTHRKALGPVCYILITKPILVDLEQTAPDSCTGNAR